MKALIFTPLRAFEFTPAVSSAEISTMPGIVLRPCLKNAPEEDSQMPLLVRPARSREVGVQSMDPSISIAAFEVLV